MQYWQIVAGSQGRSYSKYFLEYGMAFVGGETYSGRMEEIKEGDIVVLKEGTTIRAAGKVTRKGRDDKEWLNDFDGWGLSAYCCVKWREHKGTPIHSSRVPGAISRVHNQNDINHANAILTSGVEVKDPKEPLDPEPVKVPEILECLKKADSGGSEVEWKKIQSLAEYYYSDVGWHWVPEHETRTFLVVPLLLALGWSERQIKIELGCSKGKVDIALFKKEFKNFEESKNDCVAIVETKAFGKGLDPAGEQVGKYSVDFPSCKVRITTNGHCYKIYKNFENDDDIHAYMNLRKPTRKYPIDPDVDGALEAIKWLLPDTYSG
ncbi:MAG: hypothetical protein OXS28_08250 [Gammaproteobacteria bacterium]|nr:hypothetical protein [Gammaproteobacteria bacterium]